MNKAARERQEKNANEPGLHCPECFRPVNSRYVASSYPGGGCHIRRRFCECGAEVVTMERVVGADINGILVTGLLGPNRGGPGGKSGVGNALSVVRQVVRALGGKVTNL